MNELQMSVVRTAALAAPYDTNVLISADNGADFIVHKSSVHLYIYVSLRKGRNIIISLVLSALVRI